MLKSNASVLAYSLVLFVALPLLYCDTTLDPETLPRSLLAAAALLAYFLVVLFRGKERTITFSFLKSPAFACFFCYACFVTLFIFSSVNRGDALYDALKPWLYLAMFTATCIELSANKSAVSIIIKCINVSVLIFTAVGTAQLIRTYAEAVSLHNRFAVGMSVCSTLANKNVYSETLLLCLPFATYGAGVFKGFWRGISFFNVLMVLLSLVILVNLYVWLALLLCFAASLLVLILQRNRPQAIGKGFIRPMLIAGACIVFIAIALSVRFSTLSHVPQKVAYIAGYLRQPENVDRLDRKKDDNNIHERMALLRNTVAMIRESSGCGVGLANWKIYCPRYGRVSYTHHIRVDYPHNDYLGILAETGAGALAFYLLFFVCSAAAASRLVFRAATAEQKWLGLLLFCVILAGSIVSFFGFTKEKIMPMVMLMTASAMAVVTQQDFRQQATLWLKRSITLLFIGLTGLMIFVFALRISGELHLNRALKAQQLRQWPAVISEAAQAESWLYPVDFSATPLSWYRGIAFFYSGRTDSALHYFEKAQRCNPYHVETLNDMGTCYELEKEHAKAIACYERAFQINAALVRPNLVAAYYNGGYFDKAFDLAVANSFEQPVFLDELLPEKARRVLKQEALETAWPADSLSTDTLRGIFHRAERSGNKFEEELIKTVKKLARIK